MKRHCHRRHIRRARAASSWARCRSWAGRKDGHRSRGGPRKKISSPMPRSPRLGRSMPPLWHATPISSWWTRRCATINLARAPNAAAGCST